MKLFSILQGVYLLNVVPPGDEEKEHPPLGLQFSEDPHNSAIVRLRVVPPSANPSEENLYAYAVEVEFNRSGGIISQQLQPLSFVAWDRRPVEEQQADADKRHELANTPSEVQNSDDVDGDAGAGAGGNQKARSASSAVGEQKLKAQTAENQRAAREDKVNKAADVGGTVG